MSQSITKTFLPLPAQKNATGLVLSEGYLQSFKTILVLAGMFSPLLESLYTQNYSNALNACGPVTWKRVPATSEAHFLLSREVPSFKKTMKRNKKVVLETKHIDCENRYSNALKKATNALTMFIYLVAIVAQIRTTLHFSHQGK